jgi:hypothetical protein
LRTLRFISALLIVAGATASAFADLTPASPPSGGRAFASAALASARAQAPATVTGSASESALRPGLLDWYHGQGQVPLGGLSVPATETADETTAPVVRELPPLPGSAGLFLSAVLSVGAWQLVRSARHWHLGALPQWYHTACPDRIGHAVPFDFDMNVMPLCSFARVTGGDDQRPAGFETRCDFRPSWQSQYFLPVTAPRAPPSLS